jgi:DNA repair protein RecN (Recombination protein N)
MSQQPSLVRLQVENLALIPQAELLLSPGLNVITGETGAGKTMLAKALEALLGGKTGKGVVRPGANAAYVEATFTLPSGWQAQGEAAEIAEDCQGEITLARRIAAEGRSRCLIEGRTVSVETLRDLAGQLIAFYGQHEGRKLMMEEAQVGMLDRSGNGEGTKLFHSYSEARAQARQAAKTLKAALASQQSAGRELELARFELSEMDELSPLANEELELIKELNHLSGAVEGQAACQDSYSLLEEESGAGAALLAAGKLTSQAGPELVEITSRIESLQLEVADISAQLDQLATKWEADPQRQADVERRLTDLGRLARKHGVSGNDLDQVWSRLQVTVAEGDQGPLATQQAELELQQASQKAVEAAQALSAWRQKRAPLLSKAVGAVLEELAMEGAKFDVRLTSLEGEGLKALGESGGEKVEFMLQANPGLPSEPISQVASGGEISRLMLALVAEAGLDGQAVLVLDEPDTGIGGHTGHGVGARLADLSDHTQLLVISHLPQIACKADRHFRLIKSTDGKQTTTSIEHLDSSELVVDELCRMSGHDPEDQTARKASQALLQSSSASASNKS